MSPEQFFTKNMKWFALALLFLFLLKSVQSCNRKMSLSITQKEYIHTIDSLDKKYYKLQREFDDTTKILNFQLRLQSEKAVSADQRASAIQSVAEKLKSNTTTTVNVRGAMIDTTKTNKK
jgi:uncharacterized membrane protein YhiD involved in acid resistance